MPKAVGVLPVNNQSQEITTPVLMRYFLEREMEHKGFKQPLGMNEMDSQLRQLGITEGSQINDGNVQNIGQFLKVEGALQSALLESRLSDGIKTIRANFKLISVLSGQVLWEKQIELEEKAGGKIPVRGTVTTEWTAKQVRSLAKTSAGKIPRKLVGAALKSLKK